MDVFTLIVLIIGSIISVLVDIYFIILYTHKQQSMFRPLSIICKVLILLTLLQVQLQPLFLLFDITSNRTGQLNLSPVWFAIYFSILATISFFKPLASSLYQADQDDPCWKIALWSFIQVVITMGVFATFLGLGWLFWGKVYIPVVSISLDGTLQSSEQSQIVTQSNFQILTSVPCFLIGMLCLIGYPILACCGAIGMSALPFSFIMDFKNRPKWRRTNQARAISQQLKTETVNLIKSANQIKRAASRAQYVDGWLSQRRKNQQIQNSISELQNKIEKHRDFYELFRLQLNMKQTNMIVFALKLLVGILCLILTPLWLIQILLVELVYQQSAFLDKFLVLMDDNNASFVSMAFILVLTLYMIVATLKGIFFVSQSLPFIKIHPMVEGRTWLNSFMFQTNIAVIASTALLHLLVVSFPQYLRGGDIAVLMGQLLQGMLLIGVFIQKKVFIYIFLIMSVLGAFFVAFKMFCFQHKTEAELKIEQIRKKLFGKQNKNKQINIEMIQMTKNNLKDSKGKEKEKQKNSKNKGVKIDKNPQKTKSSSRKIKLQFI